jgi:hypothetical protein
MLAGRLHQVTEAAFAGQGDISGQLVGVNGEHVSVIAPPLQGQDQTVNVEARR